MGDPEDDIAPVALFLATEDSQFMTGQTLYVDGGMNLNRGGVYLPDTQEKVDTWLCTAPDEHGRRLFMVAVTRRPLLSV